MEKMFKPKFNCEGILGKINAAINHISMENGTTTPKSSESIQLGTPGEIKNDDEKVASVNELVDLIVDGRNNYPVVCNRCPSKVLNPGAGYYEFRPTNLPMMTLNRDKTVETEEECVKYFWMVPNKFGFENVGFSNTVDGRKFLTCSDCEIGPIGYYEMESERSYVALSRVKYNRVD